jgi:D-arabinonate dehydratase
VKIEKIRAVPVVLPLETPFRGGTYVVRNRNTIVAVAECSGGIVGAMYGGDEDMEQQKVAGLINREFNELLAGREVLEPDDVRAIYMELMNLPLDLGYRALVDLDMGRHGIQQQALSLVDIALWDALGKELGKPVHELLGGAKREEIPVIAIGGYYHDTEPKGTALEAAWLVGQGLSGMKMKVGRAPLQDDLERIRAARGATGADFLIAVDVNQGWTVEDTVKFCEAAGEFGLAWLEEPVKWYDCLTGLAEVRKRCSIPIVSGQGDISEFRSKDLVRYGAVDQLNTDCTLVGGISGWMNVANFAARNGVAMGHHEEPQVSATLLSVVEDIGPVEIFADRSRDPLWREILLDPPLPSQGFMKVPQGPGLGLELDWSIIDRHSRPQK